MSESEIDIFQKDKEGVESPWVRKVTSTSSKEKTKRKITQEALKQQTKPNKKRLRKLAEELFS